MKNCELCKRLARMHCESDRASLCWTCDYKVHSANFLVARHSRTLLCHVCQSPTPWKAAGLKLGPTVSVCNNCFQNYKKINTNLESEVSKEGEDIQTEAEWDSFDDDEGEDDEDDEYDDDDDDDEEEEEEEEDTDCEENQVVPWSPSTPPPASAVDSPLNSDEESYSTSSISYRRDRGDVQHKRTRESADCCYNVNGLSASPEGNAATVAAPAAGMGDGYTEGKGGLDSVDSLSTTAENNLKKRRIETSWFHTRSCALVESVNRLHKQDMSSPAAISELRTLSQDSSAVDFGSSEFSCPSLRSELNTDSKKFI